MPSVFRVFILAIVVLLTVQPAAAQEFIRLENKWKPEQQVHVQSGPVTSGETQPGWYSAQWLTEPVSGTAYFRLKNRWKGAYLHNQNDKLEIGPVEADWRSAIWAFAPAETQGFYLVQNLGNQQFLHIENGSLELSGIQPNWWSAQWKLLGFTGAGATPAPEPNVVFADAVITENCRDGKISKDGGPCVTEVMFHREGGLSLNDARARARETGNAVATAQQVKDAWEKLGLDVYAFGRVADGSFAVPVQRDHSNFKKGVNAGAQGGNQGFFFVTGCAPGLEVGRLGRCYVSGINGAKSGISQVSLEGPGEASLRQDSTKTWTYSKKDGAGKWQTLHLHEVDRNETAISLRDLWSKTSITIDLLNGEVITDRGIKSKAKIASATDEANRENWHVWPAVATTSAGVTHVSFGDDTRGGQGWGALQQVGDDKWILLDEADLFLAELKQTARDANSIKLQHPNFSVFEINFADKSVKTVVVPTPSEQGTLGGDGSGNARILATAANPYPTHWGPGQNVLIAEQEITSNYYNLTSPLSETDLNKVMVWIGKEASAATVDFCYRNSEDRPGYPWEVGDPMLPNTTAQTSRCEAKHGAGNCETPIAVTYPKCPAGRYGDGPICWQQCPSMQQVMEHGQHTRVSCGIGCASSNDQCALAITDMVSAPYNMVLSILTLGLSNAAGQAAKNAAVQTASATGGAAASSFGVTKAALANGKWDKLLKAIEASEKVFDQVTGVKDKFEYLLDNVENLETEINRWNSGYAANFNELTSYRINSIIDRHFPDGDDASYIKQKYGQYHLTTMLESDKWRIWRTVATAASFEPLSIVATVDAYANPMCRESAEPFPAVTILDKSRRGPPDRTTRSHM